MTPWTLHILDQFDSTALISFRANGWCIAIATLAPAALLLKCQNFMLTLPKSGPLPSLLPRFLMPELEGSIMSPKGIPFGMGRSGGMGRKGGADALSPLDGGGAPAAARKAVLPFGKTPE